MDCINQMMGGMMGGGAMGWLMMASVILSFVLILVGLVLLGAWLARRLASQNTRPAASTAGTAGTASATGNPIIIQETPLAIAQRRYASGEIGREVYEKIRSDLIRDGASGISDLRG